MRQHWSPTDIALMGLSAITCAVIFAGTCLLLVGVGDLETVWVKTALIWLTWATAGIGVLALIGAGVAKITGVPEHPPVTRAAQLDRDGDLAAGRPTEAVSTATVTQSSAKRRWGPGSYIGMGVLGVVIFGLPGITGSTGSPLFDTILTIGGILAAVWLLIGVISLGVRAAQHQD